jgi:hypothetical protein
MSRANFSKCTRQAVLTEFPEIYLKAARANSSLPILSWDFWLQNAGRDGGWAFSVARRGVSAKQSTCQRVVLGACQGHGFIIKRRLLTFPGIWHRNYGLVHHLLKNVFLPNEFLGFVESRRTREQRTMRRRAKARTFYFSESLLKKCSYCCAGVHCDIYKSSYNKS